MPNLSKTNATVLAIDNDPDVRTTIGQVLKQDGYSVLEAENAQAALRLAQEHRPDLIILDILLRDSNGFDLCSRLRRMPFVESAPILFVSMQHDAQDIARALDSGGDDYLRKPFAARELSARVRALLRRSATHQMVTGTTLHLDASRHTVHVNDREVILTPTEFDLLKHLCTHRTEHHTAPRLLETIWQYPPGTGDTALVRNHIRNLRRKIETDPDHPAIIVSLHGRGYMVNAYVVHRPLPLEKVES